MYKLLIRTCHTLTLMFMLGFASVLRAQTTTEVVHIVKSGETLYSISQTYGVSIDKLKEANPGLTDTIRENARLTIPSSGRFHTIQAKETLFSVSRKYGVSMNEMIAANPGLGPDNFKEGAIIVIPPGALQTTAPVQSERGGLANSGCREMHKVKKKETLYSIATSYGITVEELQRANPEAKDNTIKKGEFLCIPYGLNRSNANVREAANTEMHRQLVAEREKTMSKIRVAVIMPFKSSTVEGEKALEFYRGLLLAVDSMKSLGLSIEVNALHAGEGKPISEVLTNPLLPYSDIIFAPFDKDDIAQVGDFALKNKIFSVVSFSSKIDDVYNNPYMFLLNAPRSYRDTYSATAVKDYFITSHFIFLETTSGNEKNFVSELRKQLDAAKKTYTRLPATTTAAEIDKVLAKHVNSVIMPDASDLATLRSITPKINELKTKYFNPFTVVGYPEWQTYSATEINSFKKWDTYIYSTFYYDPSSKRTENFMQKFRKAFGKAPAGGHPSMAMAGFDSAYYFLRGMRIFGKGLDVQKISVKGYQSNYSFSRVSNWGGMVNNYVELIHYSQ